MKYLTKKPMIFDLGRKDDVIDFLRVAHTCPRGHRFGSDTACPILTCRSEAARKQAARMGSPYTRPIT